MAGNKASGRRPAQPIDEALRQAVIVWLEGTALSHREAVNWALQITSAKISERTLRRHLVQWLKCPAMPLLGDQLVMESLANPGNSRTIRYDRYGRFGLKARNSTGDLLRDALTETQPRSPRSLAIKRAGEVMAAIADHTRQELRHAVAEMDRLDADAVIVDVERARREAGG
jgi:hypothetical protein